MTTINQSIELKKYFLIAIVTLLLTPLLQAGTEPKFSILPLTPTTVQLSVDSIGLVQYQVTNNTKIPRILTMIPIIGVDPVTTGAGVCPNPFILSPNQSCLLTLELNGSRLPALTFGGPEICKTVGNGNNNPTPFLCSQPCQANSRLNISVVNAPAPISISITAGSPLLLKTRGAAGTITITNNSITTFATNITSTFTGTALAGRVTETGNTCAKVAPGASCTLTFTSGFSAVPLTSFIIQGTNSSTIGFIGIRESLAYVANTGNNTVSICPINNNGSLATCTTSNGNGTFNFGGTGRSSGVTINPLGTFAYISNYLNSTLSICPVNNNGSLGLCTTTTGNGTFSGPAGSIALNPLGTFAYVSNYNNNTVSICPVNNNGSLGVCTTTNGAGTFSGPIGFVFNKAGTVAYIGNQNSNSVSICSVNINGSLDTCTTTSGNGTFLSPQGVSLSASEAYVYVGNFTNNTASICPLNTNGSFGTCTTSTGNGTFNFGANEVISLLMSSPTNLGYIPNNGSNTVSICLINTNGSLGICTAVSGNGTFNQPSAVALI